MDDVSVRKYIKEDEEIEKELDKQSWGVASLKEYMKDETKVTFRLLNHQEYFLEGVIKEVTSPKEPNTGRINSAGIKIELKNGEMAYFSSWQIDLETLHPSSYNPIRYFSRIPISEELRNKIFKRDNFICQLKLEGCTNNAEEIDHIIPVSKGGLNNEENLQASCSFCNKKKNSNLLF